MRNRDTADVVHQFNQAFLDHDPDLLSAWSARTA